MSNMEKMIRIVSIHDEENFQQVKNKVYDIITPEYCFKNPVRSMRDFFMSTFNNYIVYKN